MKKERTLRCPKSPSYLLSCKKRVQVLNLRHIMAIHYEGQRRLKYLQNIPFLLLLRSVSSSSTVWKFPNAYSNAFIQCRGFSCFSLVTVNKFAGCIYLWISFFRTKTKAQISTPRKFVYISWHLINELVHQCACRNNQVSCRKTFYEAF